MTLEFKVDKYPKCMTVMQYEGDDDTILATTLVPVNKTIYVNKTVITNFDSFRKYLHSSAVNFCYIELLGMDTVYKAFISSVLRDSHKPSNEEWVRKIPFVFR